jgi:hypothetical protein
VATFTDTDTSPEPASNYTATVSWDVGGQLVTVTGRIVALGNNTFAVFADNPVSFSAGGTFVAQVVIRDVGGATVVIRDPVNVAHNPAIPPLVPLYLGDTGPATPQFVTMQDALTNFLMAEFRLIAALFGNGDVQAALNNFSIAFALYEQDVLKFDLTLPLG